MGISANPQIDLSFLHHTENYQRVAFISPPLPLALSEYLLSMFSSAEERIGIPYRPNKPWFWRKERGFHSILYSRFKMVKHELAKLGEVYLASEPVIFDYHSGLYADYDVLHEYDGVLEQILQGRIQYLWEIGRQLSEQGLQVDNLEDILHLLVLKGRVMRVPSVKYSPKQGMSCNRCGHQYRVVKTFCTSGQKDCYYCQECLLLGGSKPCDALYAVPAKISAEEKMVSSVRLNLDISFSMAQYEAFEEMTRFVRKDSMAECLVWEACGAGRPETVFGAVREALKRGGKVLFGVPRKDVLDDLVERIEKAFPGISVAVRYGKPRPYSMVSRIVVASTHHALKYYRNFDLVILDESDAFPFRANPILINALRRARRVEGKLIYLTPTPAPDVYAKAQRGEIKVIQIPARQHGHPLPVPQLMLENEGFENGIPERLMWVIRETLEEDQTQLLVAVPHEEASERTCRWIEERLAALGASAFRSEGVVGTSAGDHNRDRKINAFIKGEISILVTTGLTVRGDLAAHSNLAVLGSEHEIFDEGYLLQLAGRVGWSASYPHGKVWFFASRTTREIEGAVRKIRLLNEEANKRGFLDQTKTNYHRSLR